MVTTTFDGEPATDVLAPADQAAFAVQQATGTGGVIQYVWTYNHRVDLEALRRFHRNLRAGRLSHRIRRSPIPFGPPRWVSCHDEPSYLTIASPRPAGAARQWVDEQAHAPLDPERGPAWRLAVLPFSDGGAVVSLVVSRCVADGAALNLAVTEATAGWDDDCDWPAAGSRRSVRIWFADLALTARRLPAVTRAARAVSSAAQQQFASAVEADQPLDPPAATVCVGAAEWERRAAALDVSPATLAAAVSTEVAKRLGRSENGTVDLHLAVSERVSSDDSRANAYDNIDVALQHDAEPTAMGADIMQALRRHRKVHDVRTEFVPLPVRVIRKAPFVAFGGPRTVVTDNLGASHPILRRADGTDADTVYLRSLYPGLTTSTMLRIGGVLTLTFGRVQDLVFISVVAYQPGRENSHDTLHRIITDALAALGLPGAAITQVPTC